MDGALHEKPLPRLGGVAIFGAFVISLGVAIAVVHYWPRVNFNFSGRILTTILVPGLLIFLLGLYDDVRSIGPYLKFSIQALAASLLYASGLRITDLPVVLVTGNYRHLLD